MNTVLRKVAASLALSATIGILAGSEAAAASKPIKIGVVLPQQGALADSYGIPPMQGVLIAIDEINAAGGIKGRPLQAVIRDDRSVIQGSVAAFQELARDADIAAIFGPALTGAAMAARPIVNENTIPQFSLNYGPGLVKDGFEYYYRMSPALDIGNTANLAAARKIRGDGQKLAILSATDAGGVEGAADAAAKAKDFGMTVVAEEKFKYGETDYTTQMTRIKSSGATVLLSITQGIATNAMVRAAKQLGILDKLLIIGPSGLADAQSVELAGNLLEGILFWDYVCLADAGNPRIQPMVDKYTRKYPDGIISPAVFNGYDAIRIIGDALNKVVDGDQTVDRKKLNLALNETRYQGFASTYNFDKDWHNGPRAEEVQLCVYKDGKRIPAPK